MSVCFRFVHENLNIYERFFGLYEIQSTDSGSLLEIVKDVFHSFNLIFLDWRRVYFDDAANMNGSQTNLKTYLKRKEPRIIYFCILLTR